MVYLAFLYLEDGSIFAGKGFGAKSLHVGELVFTTAMNGYPESMTDPSYKGQILSFTHPLIGNYGVPKLEKETNGIIKNFESEHINVEGVVLNELNKGQKHNKHRNIDTWLAESGVPGIEVEDTRQIVKRIRSKGVVKAVIANGNFEISEALEALKGFDYSKKNFIEHTAAKKVIVHGSGRYRIIIYDFGVKHGILRALSTYGTTIIRVPPSFGAEEVLRLRPDGIIYSNGPGDPTNIYKKFEAMKALEETHIPTFGICLGHQLIALSFKGMVKKMKYGHRAINKGVFDTAQKHAVITTHNHGYAVTKKPPISKLWFYSLDDNTIEGLAFTNNHTITVQFHPEGGPGTNDAYYIFGTFMKMVEEWRRKR